MIKLGMMARETEKASIEGIIHFAYGELKLDAIDIHIGRLRGGAGDAGHELPWGA